MGVREFGGGQGVHTPAAAHDSSYWKRLNPFDLVNMPGGMPASAQVSTVPGIGRSTVGHGADWDERLWHPDNPLFWAGVFLAATFGLIATSTSVRVGPFKASASAGKASA